MSEFQPQYEPVEEQLSLLALKKTREKQSLSIEDVSERLKIPAVHLIALEISDIDQLPGLAFARGYIRTYGRFLGLDADALIRDFNAQYGSDSRQRVQTINRVKPQAQLGDPIIRISLFVFVLIIIGTSIWWWQAQMGKGEAMMDEQALPAVSALLESNSSVDTDVSAPVPVAVADGAATQAGSEVNDADQHDVAIEPESEPANLSDQDVAQLARALEQTSKPSPAGVAAGDSVVAPSQIEAGTVIEPVTAVASRLMIRFNSECWVSIKNADGKTIFADLIKAGDTLERDLTSLPVDLLIGSSRAVAEAEFRGQPLRVAEHSRKGVARMTLK